MKTYTITTYYKIREAYRVYKKQKAESKEAAYSLRKQWKLDCGSDYLGSIIKYKKL